ncbi:MAG: phosphomannomutase/phosphoglucomutase [Bdellovibrionales bacterium]|nr:phosphomannomutase/phosphoglucomutase [Bdellovibrionales bacterium]
MKINPQVFREYDIRGYVDRDLSPEFAQLLGRAYAQMVAERTSAPIAVGHDCRVTSPVYAEALARGIASEGRDVLLTGMGPTPQLYFSIFQNDLGGGIQVTGSHNPSDMNGFKICVGKQTLSGEDIQHLRKRMEQLAESKSHGTVAGKVSELPVRKDYSDWIVENVKPHMGKRKLKVVCDAGNGVGGVVGPAVLRALGVEVIELYCEPDGTFPNHHPDPTEMKNIQDLQERVIEEKADLGIGWDGDADRIGAVDERGDVIFGDMLLLIFGRDILKKKPGATIIGDVKCSSRLFSDLEEKGAKAVMWKTGHSLIKGKLRELGGDLAGEMSGHIFFGHRYFGFDDALYASARLVEILSNTPAKASELLGDLAPAFSTPEIRVDCAEDIKFQIPEAARRYFADYEVNTIDGVRIEFEKGWGLIRASNTQPALVLRFEAQSEDLLRQYESLVRSTVEEIQTSLLTS